LHGLLANSLPRPRARRANWPPQFAMRNPPIRQSQVEAASGGGRPRRGPSRVLTLPVAGLGFVAQEARSWGAAVALRALLSPQQSSLGWSGSGAAGRPRAKPGAAASATSRPLPVSSGARLLLVAFLGNKLKIFGIQQINRSPPLSVRRPSSSSCAGSGSGSSALLALLMAKLQPPSCHA